MTRQEKLDKLKAKQQKPQKDLLSAYEKLVSVLDAGVDINADELINQLEKVAGLENVVKELRTAISEFKIPELKDSVEIKGLQGLIEAVKAIKAPEAKVSVNFADTKSIKVITDKLGALVKATTDKIYVTNSQPGDFIPVRRVKLVGSKLLFDDDTWGGGMGGGTNTSGLATTAKQDEIITALGGAPVSTATSTAVTVGSSSTTILASNTSRKSATIVNDSDEVIYLKLGSGATSNSGIRINAAGGSAEIDQYTGIITGICASGSKVVTVVEL